MKIWIVYDSKFGNNKNIADLLGQQFESENEVLISHAKNISPKAVIDQGIDMFFFGGPPRAGMISHTMKKWAKKLAQSLKKQNLSLQKVGVWGTHSTNKPDTPPQFLWDAFKEKWREILNLFPAEKYLETIMGFDVIPTALEGPLEPGWEEKVVELADLIKKL